MIETRSTGLIDQSTDPSIHTESTNQPKQDKEAGRRGLAECRKEMAAYDACMQKFLAKNPSKQALFRVGG